MNRLDTVPLEGERETPCPSRVPSSWPRGAVGGGHPGASGADSSQIQLAPSHFGGDVAGYGEALVRYGLDVWGVWCGGGHGDPDTCSVTLAAELASSTGIAR